MRLIDVVKYAIPCLLNQGSTECQPIDYQQAASNLLSDASNLLSDGHKCQTQKSIFEPTTNTMRRHKLTVLSVLGNQLLIL